MSDVRRCSKKSTSSPALQALGKTFAANDEGEGGERVHLDAVRVGRKDPPVVQRRHGQNRLSSSEIAN